MRPTLPRTFLMTARPSWSATDRKDFWCSDPYDASSKGVLSRPAFLIHTP
jgi:hypothetical protein